MSLSRWQIRDFVNEVSGRVFHGLFPHIVVKLKCHCGEVAVEPPCVSGRQLTVNLSRVAQSLVLFQCVTVVSQLGRAVCLFAARQLK